ncbi:MAG: MoaD/ThiS family protein [Bacteriovorax sp.]|nr:MoaD/ThiS family protein [Rhizobacter sp.]
MPPGSTIKVTANAQVHTLPVSSTLADLMALIGATGSTESARQATATAVNGEFVSIHYRAGRILCDGDQITCFQLIVGG